jgi:S-adenosylmethionine-diacylgycerolhomoserine-N-methlytransferase
MMSLFKTVSLLATFLMRPIRGATHAERLESFYGYQARDYDAFRKTFLRGRDALIDHLEFPAGGRWCDLGTGTGYLLTAATPAARELAEILLVDLCRPLLDQANTRIVDGDWDNAATILADITKWCPTEPVDVVTFSYSLSMTPDWFTAIDRAWAMLKPGGMVGVVDFHVVRKHPTGPQPKRQSWLTRSFWPAWFDIDNVHPSPDHLPYFQSKFEPVWFDEGRSRVPCMPWLRPPFYVFVGRKPSAADVDRDR